MIEGHLAVGDAKSELVWLAALRIVEEALEAEVIDALGRDHYEYGASERSGYRNGYHTGRPKTAEGMIDFSMPQVSDRAEPFRSMILGHLKVRTEARVTACHQAPSRQIARQLAEGVTKDCERMAVKCFLDDFETCIAHMRFPINNRKAIRTTNLLERLFVEELT